MVEFTLPKNSRVATGKAWPKPPAAAPSDLTEFRIYRWDPDTGANPRTDTYYADRKDCPPMVLDGLIWIKNKIDPTLTFPPPRPERGGGGAARDPPTTHT